MQRSCHRCCCRPAKMEPDARHLLPTLGVACCRKSKDLPGQKLVGQVVLWPCDCLTPELSRAAKRRRLGRTVRAQGSRKRRQRGARAHARRPHAVACTVREPSRLRATRCCRKETLQRPRVLDGLLPREATGAPRYRGRHEPVGEAGADRQKPSGRTGGRVAPALRTAQLRKQLLQRPNA